MTLRILDPTGALRRKVLWQTRSSILIRMETEGEKERRACEEVRTPRAPIGMISGYTQS